MGVYTLTRSAYWAVTRYPAEQYRRFLENSQHWSRQELEDYRNEKLAALIAHCYENVPYYRRVMKENQLRPIDIRRAEDLWKFPVLTKDMIRNCGKEMLSANVSTMKVEWAKTGGTTGEPIRVCRDENCQAWANMCFERGLKWGGKEADEPRVILFGGSLGIERERLRTRLGNYLRGNLLLPAFELSAANVSTYVESIRESGCRFLVGYASALYRLATLAGQKGDRIDLEAVFPTAELMVPEWENTIRNVLKCHVLPFYGSGEVGSLGFSTPTDAGYLIPEEHALLEIATTDGSPSLYGKGKFLITDLNNYAMPIVRYLNGDTGQIAQRAGTYPFSRIERLDGRYNSLLMTDSGELISGVIGTHVFRNTMTVERYQIIQEDPLRVRIKIVPKGTLCEKDKILVMNLFSRYLGSRMKITLEMVDDIPMPPSGKVVFVINRCLEKSFPTLERTLVSDRQKVNGRAE
jgi:phenylacetate-CoA ligase